MSPLDEREVALAAVESAAAEEEPAPAATSWLGKLSLLVQLTLPLLPVALLIGWLVLLDQRLAVGEPVAGAGAPPLYPALEAAVAQLREGELEAAEASLAALGDAVGAAQLAALRDARLALSGEAPEAEAADERLTALLAAAEALARLAGQEGLLRDAGALELALWTQARWRPERQALAALQRSRALRAEARWDDAAQALDSVPADSWLAGRAEAARFAIGSQATEAALLQGAAALAADRPSDAIRAYEETIRLALARPADRRRLRRAADAARAESAALAALTRAREATELGLEARAALTATVPEGSRYEAQARALGRKLVAEHRYKQAQASFLAGDGAKAAELLAGHEEPALRALADKARRAAAAWTRGQAARQAGDAAGVASARKALLAIAPSPKDGAYHERARSLIGAEAMLARARAAHKAKRLLEAARLLAELRRLAPEHAGVPELTTALTLALNLRFNVLRQRWIDQGSRPDPGFAAAARELAAAIESLVPAYEHLDVMRQSAERASK